MVLDGRTHEFTTLEWRRHLETFHPKHNAAMTVMGAHGFPYDICDWGTLTDMGRHSTYLLGSRLRSLYVDRLQFLPEKLNNNTIVQMYLRTTPVPRAIESLQQVFHGMYPESDRHPELWPPTIVTRSPKEETLYPNEKHCARFRFLMKQFGARTAKRWNDKPEVQYINDRIGEFMSKESPRVAVDSKPSILGVLDTINSTRAHGPEVRLPDVFYDPKMIKDLELIALEEWFSGYAESKEYRRLGVGSLASDMLRRMLNAATATDLEGDKGSGNKTETRDEFLRFGLSGCHDTTLGGMLTSLGVKLEGWPPFTSHIAMELFSAKEHESERVYKTSRPHITTAEARPPLEGFYIRMRYNDEPIVIPACAKPGNHLPGNESFCTLAAFKGIVANFAPKNWRAECKVSKEVPAFPERPEPAGDEQTSSVLYTTS